jgi:Phosphoesterase family
LVLLAEGGDVPERRKTFLRPKSGALPDVAWIDPNFVDVGCAVGSNDDHPPSDVRAGQELVLRVLNALVRSPAWERTLLVVTHDEHGGFFDHVEPPSAEDDDPRLEFHSYGPRVPAIVVSPRVRPGVSHELVNLTIDPDQAPAAANALADHILPAIRPSYGFVAGYWLEPVDGHGFSFVVFETEEQARRSAPPASNWDTPGVSINDVDFRRVAARA